MKVLVCKTPEEFEYQQRDRPLLSEDHVILRITRIGICGTDLHAFEGTQPYFEYPRILGHELAGEIVEMDHAPDFSPGEAVTFIPYFSCGHCIACRSGKPNCCTNIKVCGVHVDGGMAEYLSVPSRYLVHGKGLSAEELALVEPLSIGAHGIRRADVRPGEFVLVVGAGPIGLGAMEFSRIAGARVIAMDMNPHRLAQCSKMGVVHVLNAGDQDVLDQLKAITKGEMPTVVIDATGSLQAINKAFGYMAHGGRYILIGLQKGNIEFSHPEFHQREGTLMSSRNATLEDFDYVIDAVKQGLIDLMRFTINRVKFSEVKNLFPGWLNNQSHDIKVLVEMD